MEPADHPDVKVCLLEPFLFFCSVPPSILAFLPCNRSVVWSVSWSVNSGILAAAGGDNQVTLWRQDCVGEWKQVGSVAEDASTAVAE